MTAEWDVPDGRAMTDESPSLDWPPHTTEVLPWKQNRRSGTREDRMLQEVATSVPPFIAERSYTPTRDDAADAERALLAIEAMDAEAHGHSTALGRFMIRSESVASSKIERVSASTEDFARAIAGRRDNASATSMVASTAALTQMIDAAGTSRRIRRETILAAHSSLMKDDPVEARFAGRVRADQNWIGGSDYSPRDAVYVPPSSSRAAELLDDLIRYTNRDDVPTIVQGTIAHAQFESIHPFGDGNGRIGRALIGAVLRRRGMTRNTVVPIASGLLARRDEYFRSLDSYRAGDVAPIFRLMTAAMTAAALEGAESARRITALPDEWRSRVEARRGSAAHTLISALFDHPILSATEAEVLSGASAPQTYAAIRRLEEADVAHEITGRKRDRVWVASDLLAELDDLDRRIAERMRANAS